MPRTLMAAALLAVALAGAPAVAQTPPSGPAPQPGAAGSGTGGPSQATSPGAGGRQGTVIGTPQDPGSTKEQSWAMAVPLTYLGLLALGGGAVFWYVLRRRSRRG